MTKFFAGLRTVIDFLLFGAITAWRRRQRR